MTTPSEVNAAFDAWTDVELSTEDIEFISAGLAVLVDNKTELDIDDKERVRLERLHELLRGAGGVVVSAVEK